MLHSAFRIGESLAMGSNSIYFPKKRKSKKHLTTSLFLSKPYCLKDFSGGRCSAKRSLNTSPNTSLILFCIYSFPEHTTFRNLMKVWARGEKVTCWVRCWVRCLPNTSLSETLVNKGILEKKVRWWGLFWNSLKLTELSTWPGLCSRLHEKGVKKATKLQRYRNIYYLCSEAA